MKHFQLIHKGKPIGQPIPQEKWFTLHWYFSKHTSEWKEVEKVERTG